jgi:hypothetical protein
MWAVVYNSHIMAKTVICAGCIAVLVTACASGPNRSTREQPIECGAPGETLQYEARFTPGTSKNRVDMLMVTFRGSKPSSSDAETVLRRCLQATTTAVRIDYENNGQYVVQR